jgi:predicted permease
VRRRAAYASPLRSLIAVDRASVWRAPALRRGGLVLLLLPGVVAAGLRVPWESLIVLPGLVAAGAGLLFGVNVFALDSSGSVWLASLPVQPRLLLLSKLVVLSETVLLAVLVAGVSAALRSPGPPTAAQVTAVIGSGLACAAVVVALSLSSSVRRPHRADLHGTRDAVMPPGALAAASLRLAVPCALVGMVIAASSYLGTAWFPLLLAVPIMLTALLSVLRSVRRWEDPIARARVVQVVATG